MRVSLPRTATLALALAACGGPPSGAKGSDPASQATTAEPDRRVLVDVAPALPGSVADALVTTGILESEAQADIIPETAGIVTQVLAEEGDPVRRGQVLAVISNPSLDANATRTTVELDKARRARDQAQHLHEAGVISDQDLRDAIASARLAQAAFEEANRSHGFTRITSPIDGTVSIREVRLGEMAGQTRAFQVVDLDRLRVVVQLPERDLHRIAVGQPVRLSGAYDEAATATGHVIRVSPVVDPQTGTVRVTIAVDPPPDSDTASGIRPGQFVKVRVEVGRHDDVLTVPRQALVWIDGDAIVWTVVDAPEDEDQDDSGDEDADEKPEAAGFWAKLFGGDQAHASDEDTGEATPDPWEGIPRRVVQRNRVQPGYIDADQVEITEGLSEADLVIVVGNANLRQDSQVRLPDDPMPVFPDEDDEDEDAKGKHKKGQRR